MNESTWRTFCASESKSHSQLISSSQYETFTSQLTNKYALNNANNNNAKYRRDRLRSISISSHQQSTPNISTMPCSPSSSYASYPHVHHTQNNMDNAVNMMNNSDLITEDEFFLVKCNLLRKLEAMSKQTIVRNLLCCECDTKNNNFSAKNNEKEEKIAYILRDIIFENITEWECVNKIQRRLSRLIKKYGKQMIINALNTEIRIESERKESTLTSFLCDKVRECKSLLLIYDWNEIAKCIILYGGNIPNLLSFAPQSPLISMKFNTHNIDIHDIKCKWNISMDNLNGEHLFLYCLKHDIDPLRIECDDTKDIQHINVNIKRNHHTNGNNNNKYEIETDLLFIYILKYEMECWNETVLECIKPYFCCEYNENDSVFIHGIIISFCYNFEHLLELFDFILYKIWKPLTIKTHDNNNRTNKLLRYISHKSWRKKRKKESAITLCILYSLMRKKETMISAIRKLFSFCTHCKSSIAIHVLINNVLKFNDIHKWRLFTELIECNEYELILLLLRNNIVIDSYHGLVSISSFADFLCGNIDNKNEISYEFIRYNSPLFLYGIVNFCHNPLSDEIEMIHLCRHKHKVCARGHDADDGVIDKLLFRGLRPFACATLTHNAAQNGGAPLPSILYKRLEIASIVSQNNIKKSMMLNDYDMLILFIIYFKFKKVKNEMLNILSTNIKIFNHDLCCVLNDYLFIDNHEIDMYFEWLFVNENLYYHMHRQFILEYLILNRFLCRSKKRAIKSQTYWQWIYLLIISNHKFIQQIMNNKYHRLWIINVIKQIIKQLNKLKHLTNSKKRIIGFAKHHFNTKELAFILNKNKIRNTPNQTLVILSSFN